MSLAERTLEAMVAISVAATVALVGYVVTRPSCEDRGGHSVEGPVTLMPIFVGKVVVLVPNHTYRCQGAKS